MGNTGVFTQEFSSLPSQGTTQQSFGYSGYSHPYSQINTQSSFDFLDDLPSQDESLSQGYFSLYL